MSDTQETDARTYGFTDEDGIHCEAVHADFARTLERRLNRANALLAEMKSAIKFAKSEAKERLQRLDSAACERGQWMDSEHRAKRGEREALARMCQAVGHLSTIAEDCEAWLNNQCDETACEFIKAVRNYAKKGIDA